MKQEELRDLIKQDSRVCEELTVGDEPLTAGDVDELIVRADRLAKNLRLYRNAQRRGGEPT